MRAIAPPPPRQKTPSFPSRLRTVPRFSAVESKKSNDSRREERNEAPFLTRKRLALLLALLAITTLALLQLWQSWRYLEALNELHETQTRVEALQAERDRLLLEVARAFSLERVEKIARERLGMTRPKPKFLVLPLSP